MIQLQSNNLKPNEKPTLLISINTIEHCVLFHLFCEVQLS